MNVFPDLSLLNKKWILQPNYSSKDLLNFILDTRNIDNKDSFLSKSLKDAWPKRYEINDLDKAIKLVINAVINHKIIGIVGDYDVDGSSATALLVSFFQKINLKHIYKIPNRFLDGYGLSVKIIQQFIEQEVDIIIAVDNGTTAYEAIDFAKKYEKQVIVLDHHVIQDHINVDALVNPHVNQNQFDILCATGIVFIFLAELNKDLYEQQIINEKIDMHQYLDIVAVATICDVMPLIGINRALVNIGLKKINTKPNIGYKSILKNYIGNIDAQTIGFSLGPYINAPGRFADTTSAIEFTLSKEDQAADNISNHLIVLNTERRKIERQMIAESQYQIQNHRFSICVYKDEWHEGVLGIVAGRLKDQYLKPTCVMSGNQDYFKGSMRTPKGFHIGNFIKAGKDLGIIEFGGGHEMAGGLSIKKDKILEFIDFFEQFAINNPILENTNLYIDACLSLSSLHNKSILKVIQNLSPFGQMNIDPIFVFPNVIIRYLKIINNNHYLLKICSPNFLNNITVWVFNPQEQLFILQNLNQSIHITGTLMLYKDEIQIKLIDAMLANNTS